LKNVTAAAYLAKRYGFEKASSDSESVLNDKEVNTVFIATGHSSHAELVKKALESGKHVFVEKPLAMNTGELKSIINVVGNYLDKQVMVGFNRRFSPYTVKIKELLVGRAEPLAMTFICNAGIIAPDMWVHDPLLGGGRIIGEACHYIDLLSFIAGSPIITVAAVKMGEGVAVRDDKMAIILGFADGSIGNVNYFGNGNKAYPKEVLEVYSEGRVLRLDNFRKLEGYGFKGFRKMKGKMDKGHVNEFRSFIKNVNSGGAPLIVFEDLINTTLASFAAVTAAEENRKIILSEEYKGFGKAENRFR
jgi:hypothetical protein